ncbi:MAG: helicase HerA-like domain-containing protein, partial [Cryomorphaceae bacterium]
MILGGAILDGEPVSGLQVKAPLSMFNRHGLISGATGTGKTKTLQGIAEGLSNAGVPVLLMDVKGDLSGMAAEGKPHPKIDERHQAIGSSWNAKSFPVELLTLSDEPGVRLRATISEFGPVLLSKILGLNDTQQGVVALTFKFCDDNALPLLDIKDFRTALQYINGDGKADIQKKYGLVSSRSIGAIMRKLLQLEQQGADRFFGEPSTDVNDLLAKDSNGDGIIHVLRLVDMQSKPQLFSTFMLCLLAEIYEKFPEQGDATEPKLVIFIDEAHLIFEEASKELHDQIETITKLIRSKGVGIFFCTQLPDDVPDDILSQLGMKVQHSLRAFTARDRKAIKKTAENYPITTFYKMDQLLTGMGIGEAIITLLNEKGIPTPVVHTLLKAPQSRMGILTDSEIDTLVSKSRLAPKYNRSIDRESAHEILLEKLERADQAEVKEKAASRLSQREKSTLETIMKSSVTNTIVRELTRGILG